VIRESVRIDLEKRARKYLQSKADKHFCPDARTIGKCIYTKGLKSRKKNEEDGPTMVEREGQMDEKLGYIRLCVVESHESDVDILRNELEVCHEMQRNDTR